MDVGSRVAKVRAVMLSVYDIKRWILQVSRGNIPTLTIFLRYVHVSCCDRPSKRFFLIDIQFSSFMIQH